MLGPTPEEKEVEFYEDLVNLARRNERIEEAINKDPDLKKRIGGESRIKIFDTPER